MNDGIHTLDHAINGGGVSQVSQNHFFARIGRAKVFAV